MREMSPIKHHKPDWVMIFVWVVIFAAIFYFGAHIFVRFVQGW